MPDRIVQFVQEVRVHVDPLPSDTKTGEGKVYLFVKHQVNALKGAGKVGIAGAVTLTRWCGEQIASGACLLLACAIVMLKYYQGLARPVPLEEYWKTQAARQQKVQEESAPLEVIITELKLPTEQQARAFLDKLHSAHQVIRAQAHAVKTFYTSRFLFQEENFSAVRKLIAGIPEMQELRLGAWSLVGAELIKMEQLLAAGDMEGLLVLAQHVRHSLEYSNYLSTKIREQGMAMINTLPRAEPAAAYSGELPPRTGFTQLPINHLIEDLYTRHPVAPVDIFNVDAVWVPVKAWS